MLLCKGYRAQKIGVCQSCFHTPLQRGAPNTKALCSLSLGAHTHPAPRAKGSQILLQKVQQVWGFWPGSPASLASSSSHMTHNNMVPCEEVGMDLQDISFLCLGSLCARSPYARKLQQIHGWMPPIQSPVPFSSPCHLSPQLFPEPLHTRGLMQ